MNIPELILVVMALLTLGFVGVRAAAFLKIPHSVLLIIFGIMGGIFFRAEFPRLDASLVSVFPELILYLLLPPLIFEAAVVTDFSAFKKDLFPISALSIVALGISTTLIGYGLHHFFDLPLLPCLTFGALISATDPVAVLSLFREVGAPKRLTTLIEGESLLNDGTAMVLFKLLLAASLAANTEVARLSSSSPFSWKFLGAFSLQFTMMILGSVLIGLLAAGLTRSLLRATARTGAAQLGITVTMAYLTFLVSDLYLHLSGVLTTLVLGLTMGIHLRKELNASAYASFFPTWEFFALAANSLVFFAVGLTVNLTGLGGAGSIIPMTLLIVYLARGLSILGTLPAVNALKVSAPISWAQQIALMWGGVRGGLALGLVLTLPTSFPQRNLFLTLAVSVVLATLFLNAVTTRSLLDLLKLHKATPKT